MKRLYLVSLILLMGCSTIRTVDDSLTKHINPAVDSVKVLSDNTSILVTNLTPTIISIKNLSDQTSSTLVVMKDETTKTLEELRKTLITARETLSNTTAVLNESKQTLIGINSIVSNDIPKVLTQTTKTLKSIRLTAVSVHKSQFEYHQFITDNWGKVVCGVVLLLLISVFHGLIQRLILGKRG